MYTSDKDFTQELLNNTSDKSWLQQVIETHLTPEQAMILMSGKGRLNTKLKKVILNHLESVTIYETNEDPRKRKALWALKREII